METLDLPARYIAPVVFFVLFTGRDTNTVVAVSSLKFCFVNRGSIFELNALEGVLDKRY